MVPFPEQRSALAGSTRPGTDECSITINKNFSNCCDKKSNLYEISPIPSPCAPGCGGPDPRKRPGDRRVGSPGVVGAGESAHRARACAVSPAWPILRLVLHEPKTFPITRTPIAARSEMKRDSISPLGGSKTGVNQGSHGPPPSARGSPSSAARRRRPIRAPARVRHHEEGCERDHPDRRQELEQASHWPAASVTGPGSRTPRSPSSSARTPTSCLKTRAMTSPPPDCMRDLRQPEDPCERGKRGWDASARRGKASASWSQVTT